MKQHVVNDQVAVRYADGMDHVWTSWVPSLRRCERLLGAQSWRAGLSGEEIADQLRRSQYRAHTAGEFAAGLVPPPSAATAHGFLMESLTSCRDTLGVIAIRAELEELDDDTAEIGLHAVDTTRDAFRGARASTALVHAWVADDGVDPSWFDATPMRRTARWTALVVWVLVGVCALLITALLVEVLILAPR